MRQFHALSDRFVAVKNLPKHKSGVQFIRLFLQNKLEEKKCPHKNKKLRSHLHEAQRPPPLPHYILQGINSSKTANTS